MNIEEIMKPYFDKKEEIEKKGEIDIELQEKYVDLTQQKDFVELRLRRLRENKEQEIEEYVKNAVSDKPDFYAGYGAMIRKDLEQAYFDKEQELEKNLKEINDKMNDISTKNAENLDRAKKFHNVDIRELFEIKNSLRAPLIQARKDLEFKLEETRLSFDNIMLKLSRFEHIYDDQHRVLNGDEYRKLFDESNRLIEVKYSLERQLNKINEYLSLTELTQEEIAVSMMSMTPWERAEYDRRKSLIVGVLQEEQVEEPFEFESEEEQTEEESFEFGSGEEQTEEESFEFGSGEEQAEEESFEFGSGEEQAEEESFEFGSGEEQTEEEPFQVDLENLFGEDFDFEEQPSIEDVYSDFIKTVYDDVLQSAKKLRSIKLDNGTLATKSLSDGGYVDSGTLENAINLPNGVYLSKKDIYDALDNYAKENKGRTFVIEGIDQSFEINKKTIRDVKKSLRDCSTIKLLRDKKLGYFDIQRVFGKDKAEQYNQEAIGNVDAKIPSGEYINLDEFGENLKNLFTEKSPSWLQNLTQVFNKSKKEEEVYFIEEDYTEHKTR